MLAVWLASAVSANPVAISLAPSLVDLAFLPFLIPLIAGAASVASAAIGANASKKAGDVAAEGARLNAEANLTASRETNIANQAINAQNIALQKEFAQSGVQWRTADARAAGIHPLAALGAQTVSFSPASIGHVPEVGVGGAGYAERAAGIEGAGNAWARGVSQAGQDIASSLHATRSEQQRMQAVSKTVQDLSLQRMGLENALLASQVAKLNTVGPPMQSLASRYLVDGQGQTALPDALVERIPLEVNKVDPHRQSNEPAAVGEVGFLRSSDGSYQPVRSADAATRMDDDDFGNLLWSVRNRILPWLDGSNRQNPPYPAPAGHVWQYSPVDGYWLVKNASEEEYWKRVRD